MLHFLMKRITSNTFDYPIIVSQDGVTLVTLNDVVRVGRSSRQMRLLKCRIYVSSLIIGKEMIIIKLLTIRLLPLEVLTLPAGIGGLLY